MQTIEEIKNHEWFQEIEWEDYSKKLVEPLWKPSLQHSNFDPEYTSDSVDLNDKIEIKEERRGNEFWVENMNPS